MNNNFLSDLQKYHLEPKNRETLLRMKEKYTQFVTALQKITQFGGDVKKFIRYYTQEGDSVKYPQYAAISELVYCYLLDIPFEKLTLRSEDFQSYYQFMANFARPICSDYTESKMNVISKVDHTVFNTDQLLNRMVLLFLVKNGVIGIRYNENYDEHTVTCTHQGLLLNTMLSKKFMQLRSCPTEYISPNKD